MVHRWKAVCSCTSYGSHRAMCAVKTPNYVYRPSRKNSKFSHEILRRNLNLTIHSLVLKLGLEQTHSCKLGGECVSERTKLSEYLLGSLVYFTLVLSVLYESTFGSDFSCRALVVVCSVILLRCDGPCRKRICSTARVVKKVGVRCDSPVSENGSDELQKMSDFLDISPLYEIMRKDLSKVVEQTCFIQIRIYS